MEERMKKSVFGALVLVSLGLSGCSGFCEGCYDDYPQQQTQPQRRQYNGYRAQNSCANGDCLGPCVAGDPGCTPNGTFGVATPYTAEYAPCGQGPCPAVIPQPVPCPVPHPCPPNQPCAAPLPCAPQPMLIQQQYIVPQQPYYQPQTNYNPCIIDPCAVPQKVAMNYGAQMYAQQPQYQQQAPQQYAQAPNNYIQQQPALIREPAYPQYQQPMQLSGLTQAPSGAPTYMQASRPTSSQPTVDTGYAPQQMSALSLSGEGATPSAVTEGSFLQNGSTNGIEVSPPPVVEGSDQQAYAGSTDLSMDWAAQEGVTLRTLLQDWSERAGWRLVWNTDREYVVEAGAVFKGKYIDVASALIRAFSRATPAPQATFYKGNRVLVVTALEGENAE